MTLYYYAHIYKCTFIYNKNNYNYFIKWFVSSLINDTGHTVFHQSFTISYSRCTYTSTRHRNARQTRGKLPSTGCSCTKLIPTYLFTHLIYRYGTHILMLKIINQSVILLANNYNYLIITVSLKFKKNYLCSV